MNATRWFVSIDDADARAATGISSTAISPSRARRSPKKENHNREDAIEPILRWVGGKRWLSPVLRKLTEHLSVRNYHEPFLGGGAAFLTVTFKDRAYLADANTDLIETYNCVRDSWQAVAEALDRHENTAEHYYDVRSRIPNDPVERSARFIFLNHTSYNGIYRVNLQGRYNVPYGYRESPKLPRRAQLEAFSSKLKRATLSSEDFANSLHNISESDLIFLDPPYTTSHNDNGFVKYNQKLFSWDDQVRLSEFIDEVKKRGAYYILCNAHHDSIKQLFAKGDTMIATHRRNSIGGVSASRGTARELLFTNLEVDDEHQQ